MMTKKQISDYFIEILNVLEIKTLPEYSDTIFYVYKNKLYMRYDSKYNIVLLEPNTIWEVFKTKYSLDFEEIKELTKNILEEHLKLKGIKILPNFAPVSFTVKKRLKLI